MVAVLFLGLAVLLLSACSDEWKYSSLIRSRWRTCLFPHV